MAYLSLDFSLSSGWTVTSMTKYGVPQPFAVFTCGGFLVTSPTNGSISVATYSGFETAPTGITGPIKVGPSPSAAGCVFGLPTVMSTADDSLLTFDFTSNSVSTRISNVPASRALGGIVSPDGINYWVAAASKAVTTIVNPTTSKVAVQLPFSGPMIQSGNAVLVADSSTNHFLSIDKNLTVVQSTSTLPPIQQLSLGGLGLFASTGNSLLQFSSVDLSVSPVVLNVPGAFDMASGDLRNGGGRPFLLVTSPTTDSIYLLQMPPASPAALNAANAASFSTTVSPGSLASLFTATGVTQNATATTLPLPGSLSGVSLQIGGSFVYDNVKNVWTYSGQGSSTAGLLFVGSNQAGSNQLNFQIPAGVSPGDAVPFQLQTATGTSLLGTFKISPVSPGIFTLLSNGAGQAAVLNQDYSLNFGTNPSVRGSVIQIFATGAGATNPVVATGTAAPASPLAFTVAQPTVSIGGKNALVQFSGLAPGYVGLWQINAVVPTDVTPGSAVALSITAGGVTSNSVTIAVK